MFVNYFRHTGCLMSKTELGSGENFKKAAGHACNLFYEAQICLSVTAD